MNPPIATRCALIGLGEAGRAFAADLVAAGCVVRASDPNVSQAPVGVVLVDGAAAAVEHADLVISLNAPSAALAAAAAAAPALAAGTIYADLNSGSPGLKVAVAEIVETHGARFADVALMAPVPGNGVRTPSLVSGSGAEGYARAIRALGAPVEVVGPQPGEAATRKLLRSVFMKGLAAISFEALAAAERAGLGEWMRGELAAAYEGADGALLVRLLEGTPVHARRRIDEMSAAREMLDELGSPARMTDGTIGWLEQLASAGVR